MAVCPNCGNQTGEGAIFCDRCGTRLPQPEVAAPAATPAPASGSVICPACGAGNVPGEAFCDFCGSPLAAPVPSAEPTPALEPVSSAEELVVTPAPAAAAAEEGKLTCPACGAEVAPGEAFCQNCGASLAQAPITPVAVPEEEEAAPPAAEEPAAPEPAVAEPATAEPAAQEAVAEQPAPVAEPPAAEAPAPAPEPPAPAAEAPAAPAVTEAPAAPAVTEAPAAPAVTEAPPAPPAVGLTCPVCGAEVEAGDAFCSSCGASLKAAPAPAPAPAPTTPPPPPPEAVVPAPAPAPPVTTGPHLVVSASGAEIPLPAKDEILIGREDPVSGVYPDVDMTPHGGEDGGVSRRHARLIVEGGNYFVEDLDSTNFTFVNRQKLAPGTRQPVHNGDEIRCGRVALVLKTS